MNDYQDKDTFWHDRPCINGEPRSNNRLTYTGYSKYLAPTPSKEDLLRREIAFRKGVTSWKPLKVNRLPEKIHPPMSKDDIIGAVSQGYITAKQLEDSHWNICNLVDYTPEKLTIAKIYKAAKILYKIRNEHRNHVWQNDLQDAYCLAFLLPPWDQYYVKRFCNEKPGILRTIAFYSNAYNVIKRGDKSSRMLLFLQLRDLNHPLLDKIDWKQWVRDYFPENHPFVQNLLDNK